MTANISLERTRGMVRNLPNQATIKGLVGELLRWAANNMMSAIQRQANLITVFSK